MYDAILSPTTNDPVFDSEMEKFLPMLNNYLKSVYSKTNSSVYFIVDTTSTSVHDIPLSTCSNNPPTTPSTPSSDDYVWDVFYHHPMLSELTEAANVGTLYVASDLCLATSFLIRDYILELVCLSQSQTRMIPCQNPRKKITQTKILTVSRFRLAPMNSLPTGFSGRILQERLPGRGRLVLRK